MFFLEAERSFGVVDVAIENAAVGTFPDPLWVIEKIENINEEPRLVEVDINLEGALFAIPIVTHFLRQRGTGGIVVVSSLADFRDTAGLTPYVSAKHGLNGIMRELRMISLQDGIRIKCCVLGRRVSDEAWI